MESTFFVLTSKRNSRHKLQILKAFLLLLTKTCPNQSAVVESCWKQHLVRGLCCYLLSCLQTCLASAQLGQIGPNFPRPAAKVSIIPLSKSWRAYIMQVQKMVFVRGKGLPITMKARILGHFCTSLGCYEREVKIYAIFGENFDF